MSLSPIPDILFTLPTNSFYVQAPTSSPPRSRSTSDSDSPRVYLRAEVKVDLLLPSSLVGNKPKKKWGLEENFDVVVPLGGRVDFSVRMKEAGVGMIYGEPQQDPGSQESSDEGGRSGKNLEEAIEAVEEVIRTTTSRLLRSNKQALGLRRVMTRSRSFSTDGEDTAVEVAAFTLQPTAAEPLHSPLSNNMVSSGVPVAHLQRMEITLQWYRPKKKMPKALVSPQLPTEGSSSTGQSADDYNDLIEEEDDILDDTDDMIDDDDDDMVDDTNDIADKCEDDNIADDLDLQKNVKDTIDEHEVDLTARALKQTEEESQSVTEKEELPPPQEDVMPGFEQHNPLSGADLSVPGWAREQVEKALGKILRFHMIKRFPLIFDGALLPYTKKLTAPKSLASSLSRFLHTATAHKTLLATQALDGLKQLWTLQEAEATDKVETIILMLARKKKAPAIDSADSQESLGKKRKRKVIIQPEERVLAYAEELRQAVRQQADWRAGKHEGAIRWVLGDAVKCIGRKEWELRRGGSGKLAPGKIKLEIDAQTDQEVEDADSASQAIGLGLEDLTLTSDPVDDLIDDIIDEGRTENGLSEDGYDSDDLLDDDDDLIEDDDESTELRRQAWIGGWDFNIQSVMDDIKPSTQKLVTDTNGPSVTQARSRGLSESLDTAAGALPASVDQQDPGELSRDHQSDDAGPIVESDDVRTEDATPSSRLDNHQSTADLEGSESMDDDYDLVLLPLQQDEVPHNTQTGHHLTPSATQSKSQPDLPSFANRDEREETPPLDWSGDLDDFIEDSDTDEFDDADDSIGVMLPFRHDTLQNQHAKLSGPDEDGFDWSVPDAPDVDEVASADHATFDSLQSISSIVETRER